MASILIVDDDEQFCAALGEQLTSFGYQCRYTRSGEDAWALLKQQPVDLVILDVMLPDLSGFALCRRIHKDNMLLNIPVLFVSAMSSDEEIAHALAQGGDDYLTKPFRTDQLMKHVQNLLGSQAQRALIDELTGLPGQRWIRLEIQKGINANVPFCVAYLELAGVAEFGRAAGAEARDKAIRHLVRMMQHFGPKICPALFSAAHMGGGHFVCVLDAVNAKTLCKNLHAAFFEHRPAFYESLGLKMPDKNDKRNKMPLLQTMFCLTMHYPDSKCTVNGIFDTLTQLRRKAQEDSGGAGVFVDRRRGFRASPETPPDA